jgi:Flp pilus assembly protein TadG
VIEGDVSRRPERPGLADFLLRRAEGATAVEFGLIAFPFIATLGAAFVLGLNFYMGVSLDYATRKASRDLMTGAAQTGNYTASQFQSKICSYLPSTFTCANVFANVTVMTSPAYVPSLSSPYQTPFYSYLNATQSGLEPPKLNASANAFAMSGNGVVGNCWLVVVQVAYPAPSLLSWLTPGAAATYKGAKVGLLTSSATLMTEPYPAASGAATSGC